MGSFLCNPSSYFRPDSGSYDTIQRLTGIGVLENDTTQCSTVYSAFRREYFRSECLDQLRLHGVCLEQFMNHYIRINDQGTELFEDPSDR
jgi:hypothetical protein